MQIALNKSKSIIESSLSYLFTNDLNTFSQINILSIDDIRIESLKSKSPTPVVIELTSSKTYQTVVIFNSLINKRNEIVSFRVNTPNIKVDRNIDNKILDEYQETLMWHNMEGGPLNQNHIKDKLKNENLESAVDFQENLFELIFEVDLEPFSTTSFTIKIARDSIKNKRQSKVNFYYKDFKEDEKKNTINEFNKKYIDKYNKSIIDS